MLRITVLDEGSITRLKLEGKLAHEWVDEAEKAWLALQEANHPGRVVVDLYAVSFVDPPGHGLLAAMHSAGAELIGSGPMMLALIEEIESTENMFRSRIASLDSGSGGMGRKP